MIHDHVLIRFYMVIKPTNVYKRFKSIIILYYIILYYIILYYIILYYIILYYIILYYIILYYIHGVPP